MGGMNSTNLKFCSGDCDQPRRSCSLPMGFEMIHPARPKTSYYHYSAPESQGALICETKNFPLGYDPLKEDYVSAYSDRIAQWDYARFQSACELVEAGDQAWAYSLPKLRDSKLKEFARVALDLPSPPLHVRVVHYFNVATGYSCPVVSAIVEKRNADSME